MTSKEIESNLLTLIANFNTEEFIYDLLLSYGISKTSIVRLKKGDFNMSKVAGEVLYKGKLFFTTATTDLHLRVEQLAIEERILKQKPRFIICTDYKILVAKDLKTKANIDIPIADLPSNYDFFLPLSGAEVYKSKNDNKADREASYQLARLYDILVQDNPEYAKESHQLNLFLSRLLFCFFAEDTDIFNPVGVFTDALAQHTQNSGVDVDEFLNALFKKLNTDVGAFPTYLQKFPYVNGGLFKDSITAPHFSSKARQILLDCGDLDWSEINPDIFGSMIQAVADPEERSDLGMHYTSVPNIKKLIEPLFLNTLTEEFDKQQDNLNALNILIARLGKIKFFDPACGSGNFLIITYKEIRLLEIEIIKRIAELSMQKGLTVPLQFTNIKLSQFYGIEIKDFAHEMAILSLWLAEHQMNKVFDDRLEGVGQSKPILPLKEAGNIVSGNATRLSWEAVCPRKANDEIYILGNPPYLGSSRQNSSQKSDMDLTFHNVKNYKKLDFIANWFFLATEFIKGLNSKYAFVTTNSITQGEQVALLWPLILNRNQEIFFAHQSFKWTNNARGNAGVSVVIIGIRNNENNEKLIFNDNTIQTVKNISPYLSNSENLIIRARLLPISKFPEMIIGSKISDDGHLTLEPQDKQNLIATNPNIEKYIKKYIGAQEFIKGNHRYCIHIDKDEEEAFSITQLKERFEKVRLFREKSTKVATRKKALKPHLFDEDKYQNHDFLLVPQTGSERREYVPIGYFNDTYLPSNGCRVIYQSQPWLFGVLSSKMHIVWVKAVAGRLKTDMQYSNTLCYNTFPFPDISTKQKDTISQYVFDVLDERAKFPEKTMAWLYNPDTMPAALNKAHKALDFAIEQIYRLAPFNNDAERLAYLFKLYEEMCKKDTLFAKVKKGKKK
ncbi:hypothetical protein ABIB40_003105 [Pedobacter sp. UYP30]|uniref:class I SAM-dependent DNA methyltransferase n=1 Tax=Pedobacter sp. UYP30 TaxID=1756400 RepID=UPI0033986BC4